MAILLPLSDFDTKLLDETTGNVSTGAGARSDSNSVDVNWTMKRAVIESKTRIIVWNRLIGLI